jgi:hypothetical protein
MLVKVRGGYEFPYRNTLFRSGMEFDIDEGTYRGLAHVFDIVKPKIEELKPEPVVEVEEKEEPEVATEDLEVQNHRAIVKPVRSRGKR